MTVLLVCEGVQCNPEVQAVDAMVRKERRVFGDFGPVTLGVRQLLRRLHYTPHTAETRIHFKCSLCGNCRQFGN